MQIRQSYILTPFSRNNRIEPRNSNPKDFNQNYYTIAIMYNSLDVEKQEETLIYDFGNFLAAIGGNLGLFLGFSCLSIIFAGVDLIMKKFPRQ